MRISDENGDELAEIVPTVEGPVATATLEEPLPAGTHTVQWRVVSSDGHPIEGTFTLTVEQDAEEPAGAEDTAEETAEPAASDAGGAEQATQETEPTSEESAEESTQESAEEGGGLSMPLLLGILGVVVVGAVIAGLVIMRRRD